MGSQAIPNASLAGAVAGMPQTVSWATLNLFNPIGVQNPATTAPVVELLNVSGSLCRVRFPLSNVQRLLPPSGWIQVSVLATEVSYELTPLVVAQVAGINSIVGIYYPAGTPPSEIVAIGGSGSPGNAATLNQPITNLVTWGAGATSPQTATITPASGAIAYATLLIVSHRGTSSIYPTIGRVYAATLGPFIGVALLEVDGIEEMTPKIIPFHPPLTTGVASAALVARVSAPGGVFVLNGSITLLGYYV